MMNKLLDDAKAAGFVILKKQIYVICYQGTSIFYEKVNKELIKFAALQQPQEPKETALQQYNALTVDSVDPDPIERLRFFLSLSLKGQDWLDVEKFIDDLRVPDDYKLVPLEATDVMLKAVGYHPKFSDTGKKVYKAMLDASPPTNTEEK